MNWLRCVKVDTHLEVAPGLPATKARVSHTMTVCQDLLIKQRLLVLYLERSGLHGRLFKIAGVLFKSEVWLVEIQHWKAGFWLVN